MSAFDLAPDRAFENQINHARENALDLSRPAGFFTGLPTAAETGVGRLVADAQRVTGLALGAAAGSFDLLTGDAIKAQDKVFEHIVAPADKLARRLTPNPTEVGLAGQVLHSLVKIGGEAALLGPTGTGVVETLGGTLDAMDKGVDLQTAGKVGLVQGVGTAVGVAVPATLGKAVMGMRPGLELLANAGFGASVNIAQGVAVRGFTSEIYEKAGRHDLAIQSVPLDREALAVDAILGAAFGAGFRTLEMKKEAKQAKAVDLYRNELAKMLKPSDVDAALVANERLKMERPEMGLPADLQSRDAHVANLKGAIDDLIEGKPVTLRQPAGEFIPDPEGAAVRKSAEDALAEHRATFDAERQAEAARMAEISAMPAANDADGAPPTIADPIYRQAIETMANETGWAEQGGRIIRGQDGQVTGRTSWVPNAEWWPGRPKELSEAKAKQAIAKALAGEPLKPAEQRLIDYMLEYARERVAPALRRLEAIDEAERAAMANDLISEGREGHVRDIADGDTVARAAKIDEAALEKAAIKYENDKEAFMREAERIVDEHAARQQDAGSAVDGRSQADQSAARSAETRPGAGTQEAGLASDSPEISAAARYAEQRPDAIIPMDDDGVSSVADANAIISDLKAAADETEVGIKAAITCFLRAA